MTEAHKTVDELLEDALGLTGLLQISLGILKLFLEDEALAKAHGCSDTVLKLGIVLEEVEERLGDEFVHNDDLHEALCDNPPETRW